MNPPAHKNLSASLEDYLEAIFWIIQAKGAARAKDIAQKLSVKASSVTGALQALSAKKYVNYTPYDVITLTADGLEVAKKVIRRHQVLNDFFTSVLGIDPTIAEEGACKLEHNIPRPILESLIEFVEFVETCPKAGTEWIDSFQHRCKPGKKRPCKKCLIQTNEHFQKEHAKPPSKEKRMTVAQLKPKEKGVVVKINRRGPLAKRLAEMGIGRGAVIEFERVAPLGDPIDIKVKGYRLSLRMDEAADIEITAP
jgi:DtxR family Mn-dependent transcriptional regulator